MNWPLLLMYFFALCSLLIAAYEHGKKKEGTHNFFITLVAIIIQLVLVIGINGWVVYP